ncbi:MAG: MarR family winged helix-turn-helix transcriptional regulator [Roseiflexaceae bacterium]|jgi:DNA-binding MarR family transcriptional regulator
MTQERTQCQALAEVMHEVNNLLRAAGAADIMHYLQTNDISVPRYMVLRMLSDTEGVNISHVATQLHLTLGSTSQLIDRLEQDGLVSRHDDEDDRRIRRIYLLAKGREIIDAVRAIAIHSLQTQLSHLPASTVTELLTIMMHTRTLLQKETS